MLTGWVETRVSATTWARHSTTRTRHRPEIDVVCVNHRPLWVRSGQTVAATTTSLATSNIEMRFWLVFRTLLLLLASLGYLANGAQAHVHLSSGERLELMMCASGSNHTINLEIPGKPAQETDTCCGDCMPSLAIEPLNRVTPPSALVFAQPVPNDLPPAVSPRSPLWPGAPPHGPPYPSV